MECPTDAQTGLDFDRLDLASHALEDPELAARIAAARARARERARSEGGAAPPKSDAELQAAQGRVNRLQTELGRRIDEMCKTLDAVAVRADELSRAAQAAAAGRAALRAAAVGVLRETSAAFDDACAKNAALGARVETLERAVSALEEIAAGEPAEDTAGGPAAEAAAAPAPRSSLYY